MNIKHHFSELDIFEVNYLAKMLQPTLKDESNDSQAAIVWSIRNRLETGLPLAEIVCALPAQCSSTSSEFVTAAGMIAYVFGDGCPDPTSGATCFHRHDDHPPWATGLEPSALIGSYFFYRG